MKFDMGQAWNEAVAMLSHNRDLVVILAAVFLFMPSLAFGVLAPGQELEAASADPELMQEAMLAFFSDNWLIFIIYAVLSTVGTLAMLALLGRPQRPTVGEAINVGFKALVPYLLASLIIMVIAIVVLSTVLAIGALAGAAIGFLVGLPLLVVLIAFSFRLILVGPIMAIDDELNPMTAIKRSWGLVKGNTRYVGIFMILLFVALIVLSMVGGMVFGVIGALAPAGIVALWVTAIFEALISAIASTVFLAVYAAIHRQLANGSPEKISETFE